MKDELSRFFTPQQLACIKHRLEVPNAVVEAFFDVTDDQGVPVYARADMAAVIDVLLTRGLRAAEDINPVITRDVLRECVEGSTWAACVYDGTPEGDSKAQGALTTLRHVAKFIEQRYQIRVTVPEA